MAYTPQTEEQAREQANLLPGLKVTLRQAQSLFTAIMELAESDVDYSTEISDLATPGEVLTKDEFILLDREGKE